jgi:hypothetical protein
MQCRMTKAAFDNRFYVSRSTFQLLLKLLWLNEWHCQAIQAAAFDVDRFGESPGDGT